MLILYLSPAPIPYACTNEKVISYELWKWENLSMEIGESFDV